MPRTTFAQAADVARGRALYAESVEAYKAADHERFLALTRDALAARPGHPTFVYNLAAALALTGRHEEALDQLERYASFGLTAQPQSDSDFASLEGMARYDAVVARLARNATACQASTVGFTLDDESFFPEGIAYHDGRFFVSSLMRRSIVAHRDGQTAAFAEFADGDPRSPLSLAVDTSRGVLWATATVVSELTPGQTVSMLRAYDLSDGALLHEIPHPDSAGFLGDVSVIAGVVLVSDPAGGAVYRIHDGTLTPFSVLSSPQGIAGVDGRIYISDYARGIFRLDPKTGRAEQLGAPADAMLLGIDGLVAHDGDLIGIQNGARPTRVLRLDLSAEGDRIESVSVLESNHEAHDEPTNGVVIDDHLWYIANGQWGRLRKVVAGDGEAATPVVLRLPLESK